MQFFFASGNEKELGPLVDWFAESCAGVRHNLPALGNNMPALAIARRQPS